VGFSVSGSAALIFVGMFIAFGMWHTAATNSFERIDDARDDRADAALEQRNTAIEIQAATNTTETRTVNNTTTTTYHLNVTVTNNGTASLSLAGTDLLLDNEYRADWQSNAAVDGDADTDLWLPGETLAYSRVYDDPTAVPDRVMVATEAGIGDSSEVADV